MLKKLLAVIMSLSMVISVASFRINTVEALGNQYKESRDVFVADCVINGLLDKSGNRVNTFSLISSTITHNYTYKALAEALMDDQTLVFNSAFWSTLNKYLKGEFSTVFQQRRLFYETILMDYLAYVDHSEEYKSSFNQDCAKYEYNISKKLVEVAGKNYKNSVDEIIKNQSLSDAIEFSDKYGFIYQLNKFNGLVSSIKENATSAKDYYDALKSALAIKNANVSRIAFLKQMKKVASDNTDFCDAVDEIIGVYEGNYASIILDGVGYTAAQHLTDWAWGELLELLPSAYSAALKAIKLGQKTLDFIFNSNDTAENNLKLLILYIIGNYARESATNLRTVFNGNQTASNGSDFVNGYLEYVIYQKYATELASGYVQESTYDGLWNQIKNSFNGTDTTYAQFKKYFEDDISISKNYINQVVKYYNLHNSYYGDFTDKSSEIVDSGTSNNMSWNLNGNGVLTISGTGNMPNYFSTSPPWYKYRESIKQVKIGDGITGIGHYAFSGCTSLTGVTIPGNVTSIGIRAFGGCKALEELTIPEGVKSLGSEIIADTYIEKIKIPSTVITSAREYCTDIGALAGDEVLTEVEFAEGMTKIPEYICQKASSVERVVIPSTVTSIGSSAFSECSSLKGLTLPAGLTRLEDKAFEECRSLASITVPKSVTSIGGEAFANCTSLKSAVIEANSKKLFETAIGYSAFSGCTSLTGVTIPGNVTSIGDHAFSSCKALEELTIPEGVKKLGAKIIADTYIEKIKVPSTVTDSAHEWTNSGYFGALAGDEVLTEVEFAEGVTKIPEYICQKASSVERVVIPSTVTSIGSSAFNGCSSLKGVSLPDGLAKIEDSAFSRCNSLTSITVPKSVTSIGGEAFTNCTSLKSAVLEANGKKLFETTIGYSAFNGCTNLTSVTIPGNVTSIGDYAFSNCNSLVANVYKNSIGLTYCKNNKIDYRIVGSYDKKHYIQIENGTCTNIDENTELKVSQLKEGNDYDVVSKSFGNFELYDLSFYKDDQKVTIDGTAIVRIPLKEGMDGSKCKVYYNDNGTFTDMGAVYKDGYMEFETNHFSQYVVAEIESSAFTLGDVNEDDKVDFLDAIVVLRHDAEIIQLTDNQMKAAEVNKDSKVDFLDAIMILRYDAEIIDSFN